MEKWYQLSTGEKEKLLTYLISFISEERRQKFFHHISYRTNYLTVVLEDIFQPHNASAVLRSCDCFGIQHIHIIENLNKYEINPDVALGSSKWLNIHHYNKTRSNTADCLARLKKMNYKIVATMPHGKEYTPHTVPLNNKIALLFGTEMKGLSEEAIAASDLFMRIPMVGFTESLNISVSAAICLFALTARLHESSLPWPLTPEERWDTLLFWASRSVKNSESLIRQYLEKNIIR